MEKNFRHVKFSFSHLEVHAGDGCKVDRLLFLHRPAFYSIPKMLQQHLCGSSIAQSRSDSEFLSLPDQVGLDQ